MNSRAQAEPIDDTAAQWAARLDGGGMTEQDHAALAAWLQTDPAHRRAFESYRELASRIDAHLETHLASAVVAVTDAQATRRQRHRWLGSALLAATAAVVVVVLLRPSPARDFATHVGERHVSSLADGSRVELNAQTEITVHFGNDERRVRFTRGEALFNVAKDPVRPFVIESPAGVVRVTGTEFNLRAAGVDEIEVTVLEGTVRVRPPGDAAVETAVQSDHQAMVGRGEVRVRQLAAGAAQDVVAWRQGQVVFDDTPLHTAAERFAAYHARTISVDPRAAELRLGGRYSLDDLDGWLESLEGALPVRVSHGPDGAARILAVDPRAP